MEKGLISVIVPCYNVEKYIDDCVESLKRQTYKNFEVIFVNDGSTDNTLNKLNELCKECSNFKIISQENKGLGSARNTGIANSTGEYITFLDSDDMYAPNFLEIMKKSIEQHDADVACCQFCVCKEGFHVGQIKQKRETNKHFFIVGAENAMCELLVKRKKFNIVVWNKIYKHNLLKQIETYPNIYNPKTLYSEDIEFGCLYLDKTKKVVVVEDKLVYYRKRKGSLIRSKFSEKKLTVFNGIENVTKLCEKNNYKEAYKYIRALSSICTMEMLYWMFKAKYKNKEISNQMLKKMREDIKYIRQCKRQFFYLKAFAPIIPGFFDLFF